MAVDQEQVGAMRCANHPEIETHLRCSRCGKPICVRCVVQTPVGGRCAPCANLKKPPMFQVGTTHYARAAAYGLAVAAVGGFIWGQLGGFFGLSWLLLALLGYGVGEAVSRGADGRIARGLVVMAGVLTVLAAVFGRGSTFWLMGLRADAALGLAVTSLSSNPLGLLFLVLAVVIATSRVR